MRGRRGQGEGSIYQRKDGRWTAVVDLGVEGGKRQRKQFYGETRAEVARALHAALRDREHGLPARGDERQTVVQYLRAWLETMRPPRIRESTWIRNESHIRGHVIPAIGAVRLTRLTRMDLQPLYARCLAKGLSPTTVNHLHGVLHHALEDAVRSDLVPRNVAQLADPPRVEKREMHIYTPEQVDVLVSVAPGHPLMPLVALTIATGMRAGEVLALRWWHVDLVRGVLHVKRTRTRVARGYTDGKPKSASGTRDIKLVPMALEALKEHRICQAQARLALGAAWVDEDRVFASSHGTAMDPSNLRKQWRKLVDRAGLPEIHFHDLRHSAASWLLSQGVPVADVAKMLGHADPSITLRIYAHAMPDSQDRVAAAMEVMLSGVLRRRKALNDGDTGETQWAAE